MVMSSYQWAQRVCEIMETGICDLHGFESCKSDTNMIFHPKLAKWAWFIHIFGFYF